MGLSKTLSLEASPLRRKLNFPAQLPPQRLPQPHTKNISFKKPDQFRCTVKCLFSQKQKKPLLQPFSAPLHEESAETKSPFAVTASNVLKSLRQPAMAAVLVALLLTFNPKSALASSGGRMGGRFFSWHSSSFSRTFSVVPITSTPYDSFSAPFYDPFEPALEGGMGPGPGFFLTLVAFVAAFIWVFGFPPNWSEGNVPTAAEKTTVLRIQVGLRVTDRSIQNYLNRIAEVADTSSPEGLRYVLTETTSALLQHPDYCISAYSSVDVKQGKDDGEERFYLLSFEERQKYDEDTLVNVNNIRWQSERSQRVNEFSNEYMVITILAAAEGVHKFPTINRQGDLKEALQKLGCIPSRKLLAVEVLWTPQSENDTLSERELRKDYPLLRPLR